MFFYTEFHSNADCYQINTQLKAIKLNALIRQTNISDRIIHIDTGKGKGKAIPLQAWTGPEGSRRLRIPDFKIIGT
jgi:hypothetical protein